LSETLAAGIFLIQTQKEKKENTPEYKKETNN
jgi:hypothetical protein